MKKHPILLNLIIMAAVAVILVIIAMFGLNIWTDHGKVQIVPDVRGCSVSEAERLLHGVNLKAEIVDSVYDNSAIRGSVIEQMPPAANRVKPGRTVYLTINAYSQRQITLPELVGISVRQARATLESLGFKDIRELRVPSDYRDLVLAIKSMGVNMRAGTKIPLGSTIVIEVGEGYVEDADSIVALDENEWSFD